MKQMVKIAVSVVVAVLAVMALPGCVTEDDGPVRSLAPGDMMPEFSVALSGGRVWDSREMSGKVCVIVFFSTGCADCRRELPELQKAYDACMERQGVEFVCIAREQQEAEIGRYWSEHGLTMPYAPQSDRAVYSLFASAVIPRVYVVNRESVIAAVFSDADTFSAMDIIAAVESAS